MSDLIPPEAITAAALEDEWLAWQDTLLLGESRGIARAAFSGGWEARGEHVDSGSADQETISSLMGSVRAAEDIIANRDRYISQLENRLAALEGVTPC